MTLVVAVIDPDGNIVMGADTSQRIDLTPQNDECCFKKVEFVRLSKLRRINQGSWVGFWGDTTRIEQVLEAIRQRSGEGDVDVVANVVDSMLKDEEKRCREEGVEPPENGFLIGGEVDTGKGRVYYLHASGGSHGVSRDVYNYYNDPIPGRFRFMYGGECGLACTTVRVIGDLVECGIVEVGATAEDIVRYLIDRTASYVLACIGVPIVGGDIETIVVAPSSTHAKITRHPVTLQSPLNLAISVTGLTAMPTGSIGPSKPIQ